MSLAHYVNLAFVYSLCAFWSAVTCFRMMLQCFQVGPKAFFSVKQRPTPPKSLTDPDFRHRRIKLSKLSIHVAEIGDDSKPLMLFVHGFPEFWYTWRHQLKFFAKTHHCVAMDMRGYGDSDKPAGKANYDIENMVNDVKELIPALGYQTAILVAHDWGGAVAWRFVIENPGMVEKFIVCNCPHPTAFRKALKGGSFQQLLKSWYMFFFQAPFLPELMVRAQDMKVFDMFFRIPPGEGKFGAMTAGTRNPKAFSDEDMEAWRYTFGQPGAWTPPINYYRAALTRDPARDKPKGDGPRPKVEPPTLIVWGTADVAITQETATNSADYCRDCTIRFIEGASHWVQNDEPQLTNEFIQRFLEN